MGRDGALHGLRDKGEATKQGLLILEISELGTRQPCFYGPGIRGGNRTRVAGWRDPQTRRRGVRDGNRTRVVRWKDGSTGPLYDTDEVTKKSPRGIGWVRTNGHPVNNRPLNQLSFDPRYRRVATPAAVAGC